MTRPHSGPPTAAALPTARGAAPVLRLVPFAFTQAFGRPPAGVWSAPYVLRRSGSRAGPGAAVALSWRVVVAAAPRADGRLRLGSIDRPDEGVEVDPRGDVGPVPEWARPVLAGITGAGGLDLLVHADLPECTGLSAAVPLACTAALIEAAFHDPEPGDAHRSRIRLTDPPLGAVALFARAGHVMVFGDGTGAPSHVPFDPAGLGLRFVLAVPRRAGGGPTTVSTTGPTAGPVGNALAAGAIEARPLPGADGSTIAVVPGAALAAVRRALVHTYTRAGEPAPRVLSAALGSPCARVA
ncbi:hypothetical protein B4N89_07725 [Embleya scabrispora]|uniref:Galactokinase n=1 Tax=Embleya scabrispora TaxID=159449 RepID=A0A1T3NW20_9ACTN|nr:hypothetical protein [Embleya scabrispora]OPC80852.1 hypothetical protein B4N89_07725 [Embleya scabrispora]